MIMHVTVLKENVGHFDELFVFTDSVSCFNIPALSHLLTRNDEKL